jgi:hypothetical protein
VSRRQFGKCKALSKIRNSETFLQHGSRAWLPQVRFCVKVPLINSCLRIVVKFRAEVGKKSCLRVHAIPKSVSERNHCTVSLFRAYEQEKQFVPTSCGKSETANLVKLLRVSELCWWFCDKKSRVRFQCKLYCSSE